MQGAPKHGHGLPGLGHRLGGFTVVEVMIVLSISALMLVAAAGIFTSRRGDTEFSQAMYDLQSKFQSWANMVSSEALPAFQQYTCAPSDKPDDTGRIRPVLTPGSGNTTGQSCVYLGQAIQVIPSGTAIYSYPVFGLRTVYLAGSDTGDFPTTVDQANPAPAMDVSGNLLLVDNYTVLNGLNVVSATLTGGSDEQDLLTLYSSLQNSNTSGNQIDATVLDHKFIADDPGAQLKQCVTGNNCSGATTDLSNASWNLCLSDGNRQAQLSVKSVTTGIVTTLNMNGCGA